MVIIPLKVYYFLTELDQFPSLALFYFRVWLKQPGTILAKLHGLLFDGSNCATCIFHQTGIGAFAMWKAKAMTHFMDGNLRQ